jgi:sarcosine oxidase
MDEPCFYGFPTYGEAGPKAAQDVGGQRDHARRADLRGPTRPPTTRVEDFMKERLPGAVGPAIYTKTCLYTMPPDRDFVLDSLPDHPNVFVALGAAHGFKYASLFGRILAELAVDGETPSAADLERFKIDRPILLEEHPATSFMV